MITRNEYPRPQFARQNWLNLNGVWQFEFDDHNQKKISDYVNKEKLDLDINVPFVYQSKLSGIEDKGRHEYVWYKKEFELAKKENHDTILHFGAVDYFSKVYLNGNFVGQHEGGHTSFSFDITDYLTDGKQTLIVHVFDPKEDETIPRGKQFWEDESRGIWYTGSTGIWQTVWIEQIPKKRLENVRFTPEFDNGLVHINFTLSGYLERNHDGEYLQYTISFKNQVVVEETVKIKAPSIKRAVDLIQNKIFRSNFHDHGWAWTPEKPNLFDVNIQIMNKEDEVIDRVDSYFGFRKIHTENGMVYLNNYPYYQKLVLDQGYWPDGLLTAPSMADFEKDITLAKEMGFNGCRKHQKTEDPLFLYQADKLGFIVWGECAAAPVFTEVAAQRLIKEWMEIVERDYNHPSIVTWVPINESWGVPNIKHDRQQQQFSETMYHLLHAIDGTRLVVSNDGWEMTTTDICAIHNYSHGSAAELKKYEHYKETLATKESLLGQAPGKWDIYARGYEYRGEPILLTEFGGIGYKVDGQNGWGYTSVTNEEDYVAEYRRIMDAIFASKALWGFCYTQLTDVEQEINGLLTYDRNPKCDLRLIKEINNQYHPARLMK